MIIKIVVDTNVILSALIKSKKIKDLLLKEHRLHLVTPAHAYYEIIKHYNKILQYSILKKWISGSY